jgi:uncharacterized glyoxalase superfamily protein PhnB
MIVNRSVPQSTVIPELAYEDVSTAAEWLATAFGFRIRLRIGHHRIQMTVPGPAGDGAIVVTARDRGLNVQRQTVLVRVRDAKAHHAQAKARGARILRELENHIYGERQYTAEDIGGHVWTFTESIADSDPRDWGGELL